MTLVLDDVIHSDVLGSGLSSSRLQSPEHIYVIRINVRIATLYLDQLSRLSNRGGKIFEELTTTLELRAYQADDLSQLPTLHKLLLETLQIAPPHWVTS